MSELPVVMRHVFPLSHLALVDEDNTVDEG